MAHKFEIPTGDTSTIVSELARKMETPLEVDCQKSFMHLSTRYGQGTIIAYHTDKGLDSVIFSCTFNAPVTLTLSGDSSQPIHLYSVAKGTIGLTTANSSFHLNTLQAAIHGGYEQGAYTLELPAGEQILLMLSFLHRKIFFKEIDCEVIQVPTELLNVIRGSHKEEFMFADIFHLPAIDTVYDIVNHSEVGLLHSAHASSQIYENMFLLINEYKRLHGSKNRRLIRDANKIELIRRAESILMSRIQNPPTIPVLAKMVGINQQTLKMGFRQLYGNTINNYLNDRRLEQAGMLINGGDMSIGEVANAVGYSNGGYFSRKFKQKYGLTPSKFGMQA